MNGDDFVQSRFARFMARIHDGWSWGWFLAIVGPILFALLLIATPYCCTAPQRSRETLESAGYQDVKTGGYGWFACGRDDVFSTKFTATAPNGARSRGVVCCGWFKGCTVRFR